MNCLVVGLGYMGGIRCRVVEEIEELALIATCDPHRSPAGPSNVSHYADYIEAIDLERPDIVFVCTPNDLSPDVTVYALEHGCHVFCEKPPGRTLADVRRIMDAEARHADQKLVFGFNHRHHPATLEAKAIVEAGTLGRILWLRGVYGKSGGLGDDFESSWRNDPAISGGGILLDQGIHMLDLFRFFCGDFDEILSVCATSFWDVPVEDNAMVLLRARTGSVAQLHSSSTLWRHTFRLEIGLEGGYLIVEGLLSRSGTYGRETLVIGRKPRQEEVHLVGTPREEIQYFDEDLSWHLQVEGLLNCIKEKRPVQDSTSLDALRVMEIISEVYATASLTNQSPSLNPAEAQ